MTDILFTPETPGVRHPSTPPGGRPADATPVVGRAAHPRAVPVPATAPGTGRPALTITVHGMPGPQGSKRHVGRGVMVESSKKVAPWREAVKAAALTALDGRPRIENTPVRVAVTFCFDKPKSAPKRHRTWPITQTSGDVDKLQRSTFDALQDAGVFKNDSQVIDVHARKVFTDEVDAPLFVPGAVITVWEATAP